MSKHVLVSGGTGFVGRALTRALVDRGDAVTVLSRDPGAAPKQLPRGVRAVHWNPSKPGPWCAELGAVDAVVHLAGAPVATRWTDKYKKLIDSSRGDTTRMLVEAMGEASSKPRVLVSASATGYYGADRPGEELVETSEPGSDFLAEVCQRWEQAATAASEHEVRAVQLRIGVVLGADGGALSRMVMPMRAFVGGPIGDGKNELSWVQRSDVVGMALAAIDDDGWSGPYNCVSPNPTTGRELAQAIGSVIGRPALPVPAGVVRAAMGDAVDVLLGSQRVLPRAAIDADYAFHHTRLVPALEASLMADS